MLHIFCDCKGENALQELSELRLRLTGQNVDSRCHHCAQLSFALHLRDAMQDETVMRLSSKQLCLMKA